MKIDSKLKLNQLQMKQSQQTKAKQDFKKMLTNQVEQDKTNSQDELKKVSEKFESLFVGMMFKQMKKAGFKSKLLDTGLQGEIYQDMYYNELSKKAAQGSKIGISEAVYRQLNQGNY
ncbi:hypothetical protein JCM16358_13500 [Halanaerocella petrolearia]